MSSAELDDIVGSMEAALRRAYALGRQDAIDQLTKYLQSDGVVSQRLALAGPADSPPPANSADHTSPLGGDQGPVETAEEGGSGSEHVMRARDADRHMALGRPVRGGIMGSIRDFVYPSRAD